jgi:hypothetical protein
MQPTFVHTRDPEVKGEATLSCRGNTFATCNFCLYRALRSRFPGVVCVFLGVFYLPAEVKHNFSENGSRVCQKRRRQ